MPDISIEVVLGMLFLILSNADIRFAKNELIYRPYTVARALLTRKWVELIDRKKFAKAALDVESKIFMVYISALEAPLSALLVYSNRLAQIAFLLPKKVTILDEYSYFADVFSKEKLLVLPEKTNWNIQAIELEGDKQPPYGPIYSLGLMELVTLKIYIEIFLKTGFIWPSKSSAGALILFDKKPDGRICLCVDY